MANLNNVHDYISAGFARLDFHRLDSLNLPAGVTGSVTPGAVGVPAGRITAVKTANINIPTAEVVPVTGDNAPQGNFVFPNSQARQFDISAAWDRFDNREAFQGIKTVDIGNHSFAGRDALPFVIDNTMMIAVSNASSKKVGAVGNGMYAGVIAARTQMTIRGRNSFVERQAAQFDGTVVLNPSDSYPWGQTFQVNTEGYLQSFIEDWTLPYPVTCHRWTQSSGVTKFYLGEKPASTSLDDVLVYVLNTSQIPTRQTASVTISDVDNSISFSVAPTDAYDIIAWYGYVPS